MSVVLGLWNRERVRRTSKWLVALAITLFFSLMHSPLTQVALAGDPQGGSTGP